MGQAAAVFIFFPRLFKRADQFAEYLPAADCKHILIDRRDAGITDHHPSAPPALYFDLSFERFQPPLRQGAMLMPIRFVLALLFLAIVAPALAAAPEQWEAVSKTAMAITGNVRFSPDRITFGNGKSLPLAPAGDISGFGTPTGTASATLYRVIAPSNPVLLHGNRLCGQPVTFIAVWKPARVGSDIDPREMAAFSGSARPTVAGGSDFCGTYYYELGHR